MENLPTETVRHCLVQYTKLIGIASVIGVVTLLALRPQRSLSQMAPGIVMLFIGIISFATTWVYTIWENRTLRHRDTLAQTQELIAAQERLWNLNIEPLPGFRHGFFVTREGVRIHFIVNDLKEHAVTPKRVVIFIHGFPDSYLLWRHYLTSPYLEDHFLVAVDLPGYGGSDSLPKYDSFHVLESLTEFLLDIRTYFRTDVDKLVVVTHDWGSLIGARLASEAKELADHWIITSGLIPQLTTSNAQHQGALAKEMLLTWLRSPCDYHLLKGALNIFWPVISQFRRSFYIFCFLLPKPLARTFATFGNYWFLRTCNDLGKGPLCDRSSLPKTFLARHAAEAMATSTGPGMMQSKHMGESVGYGKTVFARVHDRGMSEKMRIYREGLFTGEWRKSKETTVALEGISFTRHARASGPLRSSTTPKGALQVPATIVLGEHDPAFEQSLSLDNIRDYLVKGSQVLVIKGAGHWLPLEPRGSRILENIMRFVLYEDVPNSEAETPSWDGTKPSRDGPSSFPELPGVEIILDL